MNKNPPAAKRGIPPKSDFKEWYPFIVEVAELVDKRYPIKGMDVWRPYGWKTMRLIDDITHREMERTDHEEVNFPLLIPEELLDKENISLEGIFSKKKFKINLVNPKNDKKFLDFTVPDLDTKLKIAFARE